jgi:hypothetical protein
MRHVAVPFDAIHVGDVIDRPLVVGSDSFEVVTRVGEETSWEEVNHLILSVGLDGKRHRLEWRPCPDTQADMLDRVGEGCVPTAEGLNDFLVQHGCQ